MEYIVSVIMPVYNVEKYLEEAIDSVIEQTLGFRDNIQLILVNDGSPDRSGDICRKYAAEYPDNIVYVEKENGGVSSARNAGIGYVKGQFVNFMDADDIWGVDAFRLLYDFHCAHKGLKIASGGLQYTGRDEGRKYALDYVYRRTRVVNIEKTADMPLYGLPKVFFAADLIRDRRFDTALAVSEDQLFLMDALLEHGRFGIVSDAVYYYRKRDDGSSAYDGARARADYYTVTPERAFKAVISRSVERYGSVIPYIQNVMLVNLRFRMKPVPEGVLSEEELSEYRETMRGILSVISDDIIMSQKKLLFWQKVYFLKAKYCDCGLTGTAVKKLQTSLRMQVDEASLQDAFVISGDAHEKWISEDCSIYAEDERGTRHDPEYTENEENDKTGLFGDISLKGYRHVMALPLRDGGVYSFFAGEGEKRAAVSLRLKKELKNDDEGAVFENSDYLIKADDSSVRMSRKKRSGGMMGRLFGSVSGKKTRILCILCMMLLAVDMFASIAMPEAVYAASSKVRIGHAVIGEKGLKGNKPGDQSGNEVFVEDWSYSIFSSSGYHWVYVLRPKNHDLARAIAEHMEEICENKKIGYDQNTPDSGTLFDEAKKNDWDITRIKTGCETTCSNAVAVCLRAEGVKVPKYWNTSRMKDDLLDTDMFECLKAKAYTKSPDRLVVGDILITPGRHTAIVVESDNPFTYKMTYKNRDGDTSKIEVEENTYVRLNPNNGSEPDNIRMDSDKDITKEVTVLRDHTFIGWKKTGRRTLTAFYKPERQKMKVVSEKVKI